MWMWVDDDRIQWVNLVVVAFYYIARTTLGIDEAYWKVGAATQLCYCGLGDDDDDDDDD